MGALHLGWDLSLGCWILILTARPHSTALRIVFGVRDAVLRQRSKTRRKHETAQNPPVGGLGGLSRSHLAADSHSARLLCERAWRARLRVRASAPLRRDGARVQYPSLAALAPP
eukprot:4914611-Prymnesium_polylepis.1